MLQVQLFEALDLVNTRLREADQHRLAQLARSDDRSAEPAQSPFRRAVDRLSDVWTVASGFAASWLGAPHA